MCQLYERFGVTSHLEAQVYAGIWNLDLREASMRSYSPLTGPCAVQSAQAVQVKGEPQSDAWLAEGEVEIEKQLRQRQGEREEAEEKQPPAADPVELAEHFKVAN